MPKKIIKITNSVPLRVGSCAPASNQHLAATYLLDQVPSSWHAIDNTLVDGYQLANNVMLP
jgi:hypothetical protein